MDTPSIVASVVGASLGGITAGVIAKLFLANYIRSNDNNHIDTKKDLKDLSSVLSEVRTSIAVLNTKLEQLNGISKEVIVLQETCKKHGKDINAAHDRLRSL